MKQTLVERLVVWSYSPPWPYISVLLVALATISAGICYIILSYPVSTAVSLGSLISGLICILIIIISYSLTNYMPGIKITCLQTQPKNSVENHHNNRFRINNGIGHLRTYIDIPDWATTFRIQLEHTPDIEIIPFENKPNSIHYEDNVLKSDQDISEFPLRLKLVGDTDNLARGEYGLKFKDLRTNRRIMRITLKCDPEPPDHVDEDQLGDEEMDAWI